MTKEQLITKLDGARERDAILRRKLEIGDEDLMEFARKQSELVDHLAESREQTRNLENALVQAERSTYAAKGELNICEAEKINLESQLKTYVRLTLNNTQPLRMCGLSGCVLLCAHMLTFHTDVNDGMYCTLYLAHCALHIAQLRQAERGARGHAAGTSRAAESGEPIAWCCMGRRVLR